MARENKKILLGMLVSNGDCLMATVLAKQIKKDYPGCHLTWAISNLCRQVIENNPDVDAIWEITLANKQEGMNQGWFEFVDQAKQKKADGEFDEIFLTQIYPSNVYHYDGTTRGTVYNAYPKKVSVAAIPVLRLYDHEIKKVSQFAEKFQLGKFKDVILFECAPDSGQSFVTPEFALEVAGKIVLAKKDIVFVISTHLDLKSSHERIIIGNKLTLRENAELTKYCSLLVGCSSGISWICTSDWANPLPSIQFLKRAIGFRFASVVYDHKYWGLDYSRIIETTINDTDFAVKLILDVMDKGIRPCVKQYHKNLRPLFISMVKYSFMFFRKGKLGKAIRIIRNFSRRNYFKGRVRA